MLHNLSFFLYIFAFDDIRSVRVNAFTIDSISSRSLQKNFHTCHNPVSTSSLLLSKDDDDNIEYGGIDEESGKTKIATGLDLGFLKPLTSKDAEELKAEASSKVNAAFDKRRQELLDVKASVSKDYEESKVNLKYESEQRAEAEAKKLMDGMDALCNDFLEETKMARESTKMAARADRGMEGKGLELGSWGTVGGFDVLTEGDSGGGVLLGSVGSIDEMKKKKIIMTEEDNDEEEEFESKILVVFDGNKDKSMQKVLDRFTTLLSIPLPSITLTNYLPTSLLPMGGNGAQVVIIVSSSLSNGRSSAEPILSRLLKQSLPQAGARITPPPSHIIVLSSLGTERTDKFPYSMQNMMGGKLSKMYDVEDVVTSTVKGRLVDAGGSGAGNIPLDYTVIKLGEIVDDSKLVKNNSKGSDEGIVTIRPGDSLDGSVGIEAAANVLLQAVAMQPNARNATMSVIGGMLSDKDVISWDDAFLRLDGPELWRIEENDIFRSNDEGEVNRLFDRLTTYLGEWSLIYDDGAKGTGLTTPVSITKPKLSIQDGEGGSSFIRAKWSVRLEFKATNTGAAYKSKSEERQLERERSTPSNTSSKKDPVVIKNTVQRKEGGVEILVEKTSDKDGIKGIRVRAKRCNMSDFTVIKEISEESIVKKVQEAVKVWKKQFLP